MHVLLKQKQIHQVKNLLDSKVMTMIVMKNTRKGKGIIVQIQVEVIMQKLPLKNFPVYFQVKPKPNLIVMMTMMMLDQVQTMILRREKHLLVLVRLMIQHQKDQLA